jgi:phosphoserine aminotransferase
MMNEQIRWFNANGGLNWCVARTKESSDAIYDWAQASEFASPFVSDPAKRSQVVVTVDFIEAIDAEVIAKVLRANGIVDTEPYRKLGRNQLRISVFPAVDPSDVKQLLKSIDFVIAQLAN